MIDSRFSLTPTLSRWERETRTLRSGHAAHAALDKAVDKCYRPADFPSDRARVEYHFQLYEQLTAPLAPTAKPKRIRKSKN